MLVTAGLWGGNEELSRRAVKHMPSEIESSWRSVVAYKSIGIPIDDVCLACVVVGLVTIRSIVYTRHELNRRDALDQWPCARATCARHRGRPGTEGYMTLL